MKNDTIAAISSAAADAGIGIVRISGEGSFAVIDRIYRSRDGKKKLSRERSHTIHYGYIMDGEQAVDEVLVMIMRGPGTFTAEDTVEIDCHGGICVMKKVLELALRNGARLAEPGEFTKRAFLNGRIDLSQVEAVMDVIQAKNEYALRSSVGQLRGSVRETVGRLRGEILSQIAFIEAALDDPEHMDLDGYQERAREDILRILGEIGHLIDTADNGRLLREGIDTVIAGRPNAGKSSLLNTLLGEERAIVTEIPGTTRDVLEETINLGGITLNITDTAGIRKTQDVVEKIGVGKARRKLQEADLVLYVVDSSGSLDENDEEILRMIRGKKAVVLLNKTDLPAATTQEELRDLVGEDVPVLPVSALKHTGIGLLEDTIKEMFWHGELCWNDEVCITNLRQKSCLKEAQESLLRVLESLSLGMPEDFLSIDLRDACEALGGITGDSLGEDLVNEIFGKFCMGK